MAELLHGLQGLHGSDQKGALNGFVSLAELPETGLARALQLAAQLSVERDPEAITTNLEHDLTSIALQAEHRALEAVAHGSLEDSGEAIEGQAVVVLLGLRLGFAFQLGLVLSGEEQQPGFLLGAQASFRTLLQKAVDEFVALQTVVAQEVGSFGLGAEGRLKADDLTVLASDGEHGSNGKRAGPSPALPRNLLPIAPGVKLLSKLAWQTAQRS